MPADISVNAAESGNSPSLGNEFDQAVSKASETGSSDSSSSSSSDMSGEFVKAAATFGQILIMPELQDAMNEDNSEE